MNKVRMSLVIAAIITLFTACVPTQVNLTCNSPPTAVAATAPLAINLYVDGTPSMQGFVSDSNSRYVQTLEQLLSTLTVEPVALDGKPRSFSRDVKFFRLGKNDRTSKDVQPISRSQYRQAELSLFYSGNSSGFPLLSVSQIDAAIIPPDVRDELTLIVTDLYQVEEDASKIVNNIKPYLSRTTSQAGAVGVLGIRSEFRGTVYTEALAGVGEFSVDTKGKPLRPFYILLIGQLDDVHFYINELLKSLSFGKEIQTDIFSPYRMHRATAHLEHQSQMDLSPEQRKQIRIPKAAMRSKRLALNFTGQDLQPLVVTSKKGTVELDFQANLTPISYVLGAGGSAFTATITPKSFVPKSKSFAENTNNPSLQQVLSLGNWQVKGNILKFSAQIQPELINPPGIYLFEVDTRVDATGDPLPDRPWWQKWNSLPTSKEGSKTHDLQYFLTALKAKTTALMRQQPPIVGRFCYVIQKG